MNTQTLSSQDIKNSIGDGIFATMFATLTGGVFLTGFALYLGMSEVAIGVLAAIPYAVSFFQLPTSFFIAKKGKRKRITVLNAAVARLTWLFVLAVALMPFVSSTAKIAVLLTLIFISHAFIAISYVSWLSWISDLVPDKQMGRFFGTRNMINGIAGMVSVVVFGHLLDHIKQHFINGSRLGFSLIFVAAVVFGILSLGFLVRVSGPTEQLESNPSSIAKNIWQLLREENFRRFLLYALLWNFAVYFASPFFTLYFLRDLKFGYGFVSTMAMISSIADLTGMKFWGVISDRVKNKVVIHACSWVAVLLPLLWTFVKPDDLIIPICLHILGGSFWAGIQLCTNNLVLRISPRQDRALYISMYNIISGVGAVAAPILAGVTAKFLSQTELYVLSTRLHPLQIIFLTSTVLRILSLQLLKNVHEPEEATIGQLIRILRNVRGLNTTNGFNNLLHPFIELPEIDSTRDSESREAPRG